MTRSARVSNIARRNDGDEFPWVLVADDNRDTVLTLMLLRQEGYEVRAAYTGTDVMRIARLHHFDAVILDIEMPEMSGYAVAQELRTLYYATRARC